MDKIETFIYQTIRDHIIKKHGKRFWYRHSKQIKTDLSFLKPDKSTNENTGYIAFHTPNKPRMKLKTGRFLTRKLNFNKFLCDGLIREISDHINENLFPNLEIKLCKGKEITKNYKKAIGGGSCMCNFRAEFTRLYEMNPDRFQQLVMFLANDSARAIVHKLDCGDYLLDRVYSSSDFLARKMRGYAIEQGWYYRESASAGKVEISHLRKKVDYNQFVVSNLAWEEGCVPFMDTLCYYQIERGKLKIIHPHNSHLKIEGQLDSTEGYISPFEICCNCATNVNANVCFCLDDNYYCDACYEEIFDSCYNCGNPDCKANLIYLKNYDWFVCERCLNKYYNQCKNCNDFIRGELTAGFCTACRISYKPGL